MKRVFKSADILIPKDIDMTAWSVVACDQFTSEPEYWAGVEKIVGDRPSTLRMMLPEAYLGIVNVEEETKKINATMSAYLASGLFRVYENSYIYVERTLSDGTVRRGLVGMLDLEEYDYSKNSVSPIRPPRARWRTDFRRE